MARKLKPRKVGEVKHKGSGVEVPIFLDRNELDFFADFGGQTLRDGNAKSLQRRVWMAIDAAIRLDWQPVIEVREMRPFATPSHGFVGFEAGRFLWTRRHNGTLARVEWRNKDVTDKYAYAKTMTHRAKMVEEFDPPYRDCAGRAVVIYLPYTDELWNGLQELERAILILKARLTDLLMTEEGRARLAEVGQAMLKALPAPGPEKGEHEKEEEVSDGH